MESNQALIDALAMLGETELPSASQVKPRRRYAKRAPKQAPAIVRLQQAVSMDTIATTTLEAPAEAPAISATPGKLSREFVTAGKAIFTISKLSTGERFTYKVSAPDNFRGEYFGAVMKGSDNENDYRYIGMVAQSDLSLRFTKGSKFAADTKEARGLAFALAVVAGRKSLPEGYELRHAGKCGRCGRTLTVPESIDSGIGPDCAEIMGIAA